MSIKRFSAIINDELKFDADYMDAEKRFESKKDMDLLQTRASEILQILIASKDFQQTYVCSSVGDLHVFSFMSKRMLVLDVLTRCSHDQLSNIDTYKFTAHPNFEKKISAYTRTQNKPNPQLSKCRSWDVALNVILKVEALDSAIARLPNGRLLFREYNVLRFVWDRYIREGMELDEMMGIPMVFDYIEVPNPVFNYEEMNEYHVVDVFGNLMPWKRDNPSTMSYMSMEQMGPNIRYLQELMLHTKRKSRTFDLETSFKVFDQLICRCLQLHRFGVVHNCIEPRNIYFGRSIMFNVVYLGNYSRSMIMEFKDRKPADVFMGGDPRYMSQFRVRGAPAFPLQDIEAAFYTLLSMIVSNLPWDIYLAKSDTNLRFNENQNNTDATDDVDSGPKVRDVKASFWNSMGGINRVLADIRYQSVGKDPVAINLASEIIRDLYSKLRDQMQMLPSSARPKTSMVGNLISAQTSEFQFYIELRRTALLFFRFESISVLLCTPTYQKKIETIARDEVEQRPAWNISNWCFNMVQMSAPGNQRLSMPPADAVAHSYD